MFFKNLFSLSLALLSLSACTTTPPREPYPYLAYLKAKDLQPPTAEHFLHCRGYGCAYRDQVTLSKAEWAQLEKPFQKAGTAAEERRAIAESVALMERIVGEKTGTSGDVAGTFGKVGTHQLDCVDESTNTTLYLAALEQRKMLRHHKLSAPTTRTPFTGMAHGRFWPHQTAVIFAHETGNAYAVDSWYRDNGALADIVPLDDWLYGWGPADI